MSLDVPLMTRTGLAQAMEAYQRGFLVWAEADRAAALVSGLGVAIADPADAVVGADVIVTSGIYLRGDEANLNPKQPGFVTVNLRTAFKAMQNVEVYALVNNVFDRRYATAGGFFNTGAIPFLGLTDPRSLAPGTPRAFYAGVKAKF